MDSFKKELHALLLKHDIYNKLQIPTEILISYMIKQLEALHQYEKDSLKFYMTGRDLDEGPDSDQMDGDHESALKSAGFGTDEDYGDIPF